jgi:hypothetical protein
MSVVEFDTFIQRAISERQASEATKCGGTRYRWSIHAKQPSSEVIFEHGRELCFRRGRWYIGGAA